MKRIGFKSAFVLSSVTAVLCQAETPVPTGNSPDQPYKTIVERNPFGIKPPPPPAPPPSPATDPIKSDLKLTGIISYGRLKAYFMATDPKDKKTDCFSLGVDEKKDGIEVLGIDETARSVRIRSAGVEMLMTFATHGVEPAPVTVTPGTPSVPGAPGRPPGGVNSMPVTTGIAPSNPYVSGMRNLPSRTPRTPLNQTAAFGSAGPGGYSSIGYSSGSNPGLNPQPQATPQNTLSGAEQAIMMEVQRMQNPSLPPTPGLPTTTDIHPGGSPTPGMPGPGMPPGLPRLPGQ